MTNEQPSERVRLRLAMESRKEELGKSWRQIAREGGIKEDTVLRVRNGADRIQATTRLAIDRGMEWLEGSVTATLAGGDPTPLEAAAAESHITRTAGGGRNLWLSMPNGERVIVPLAWDHIHGLKDTSEEERSAIAERMIAAMLHAGAEFLREEGLRRSEN